jgi:hypothetical protein
VKRCDWSWGAPLHEWIAGGSICYLAAALNNIDVQLQLQMRAS